MSLQTWKQLINIGVNDEKTIFFFKGKRFPQNNK